MRVRGLCCCCLGWPWGKARMLEKPDASASSTPAAGASSAAPAAAADSNAIMIPAGTKIPLSLKQAISTKNAREGDAVYAETAFPFVMNERVIVPAGTYIQGKILHVERAGQGTGGRRC